MPVFYRYVTEIEVGPGGRLLPRPGAAWRPEPARGEASVHRDFARLASATDRRIAAFASVHGLLRRQAGGVLSQTGPAMAVKAATVGQQGLDDAEIARDWIDAGAKGEPPAGTADTVATVAMFASLPEPMLATIEAYLDGRAEETTGGDPATGLAALAGIAPVIGPRVPDLVAQASRIRELDPDLVQRGLRVNEWVSRVFGGLDPEPASITALGGATSLLGLIPAALPEILTASELLDGADGPQTAYVEGLATETVADWRQAAQAMGHRVRTTDLVHRALATGLTLEEKRDLARECAALAGFHAPAGLSAVDLAERTRVLMTRMIEADLHALGAWPPLRYAVAGLHVRTLVAAWAALTDAPPPVPCATPGCRNTHPATRNRQYCDACGADRRSARTRTRRAVQARAKGQAPPG